MAKVGNFLALLSSKTVIENEYVHD